MIASADTAGKPSLGWRGRRAAERLSERVSSALPGSDDRCSTGDLGEKIVARTATRRRAWPRTRQHRSRTKRPVRRSRTGTRPRTGQRRRRTRRAAGEEGPQARRESWPPRWPRKPKRLASAAKSWQQRPRKRGRSRKRRARGASELAETARDARRASWLKRRARRRPAGRCRARASRRKVKARARKRPW